MTIFFTSDTHFDHKNICKYSNRPFSSVEEMNQSFIDTWNTHVGKSDTVYHLGDFAFSMPGRLEDIRSSLSGTIHLVKGNHDKHSISRLVRAGFQSVSDLKDIEVEGQHIVLCHYPLLTWHARHHGSWMLHGHSHGSIPDDQSTKRLDVGVDAEAKRTAKAYADAFSETVGPKPGWYRPISFESVKNILDTHDISPVDHHETRERR